MPDIWGLVAICTKFTLYLGVLTSAGLVMCSLIFRLEPLRRHAAIFAALGAVAAVLSFALGAAMLTGQVSGMIDPEMLSLLWSTPTGTALSGRVVGLALLMVGLLFGQAGLWVSIAGALLAIWSFAQIGHIAARDALLLNLVLVVHIAIAALWIGILIPLKRLTRTTDTVQQAGDLGHRFGKLAMYLVPALIIAGLVLAYLLVGSFGALFGTAYGQALVIKIALVGCLLGLAAANKLRFVPRLHRGDSAAAAQLSRVITAEWCLFVLILAVTAVLTSTLTLPL